MTITQTTLSNAVGATDTQIKVASATGIVAPGPNKTNRVCIWIDREQCEVLSLVGTVLTVVRGTNGTLRAAHSASQVVYVGNEQDFAHFADQGLGLYSSLTVELSNCNPVTAADTATLTTAQLLSGWITGTPTAAATYTLPTATLLIAALQSFSEKSFIGQSFEFTIVNTSAGANTITVAAGTGGTTNGTMTIAQNAMKKFRIVITGVDSPAYNIYSEGSVTY